MTPELAAFSNWTLAVIPRLFLYPGGLSLLVLVLAMRFAAGGRKTISLHALSADLGSANLLSIAIAWTAVALSPFPGASALPAPVDSLALAALPVLSLLIDRDISNDRRLLAAGAITLALIMPAVEYGSLLVRGEGSLLLLLPASLAVVLGLLALSLDGNPGIASEMRWLAWFCLGVVPLWQYFVRDSPWAASIFMLVGVLALNSMRNVELRMRNGHYSAFATAISWLLALWALLWALLAAP